MASPGPRRKSYLDLDEPFDPFAPVKVNKLKRKRKDGQTQGGLVKAKRDRDIQKALSQPQPSTSKAGPPLPSTSGAQARVPTVGDDYSREGRCCVCQMPLDLLGHTESPAMHTAGCLEHSFEALPPCQDGLACQSTVPRHYRKFSHFVLAASQDLVAPGGTAAAVEEDWGRLGNTLTGHEDVALAAPDNSDRGNASESVPKHPGLDADVPAASAGSQEENEDIFDDTNMDPLEASQNLLLGEATSAGGMGTGEGDTVRPETSGLEGGSPVKIEAETKGGQLNVELEVDPSMHLTKLRMKIQTGDLSKPIVCKSDVRHRGEMVPREEAAKMFSKIFAKKQKEESEKILEEARRKGYNVPGGGSNNNNNVAGKPRQCPFYKRIPNTPFAVDAFSYGPSVPGVTKYFLSHFHYDHYRGLRKGFRQTIICSRVTARLLALKIKVDPKYVRALTLDEPVLIDGVEVTLLEANHCPGAVMFLFKLLTGKTYLHVGDFRASPEMEEYPALWNCRVDRVYLDTTYCKPEYDFPTQPEVVAATVQLVEAHLVARPRTVILVGSYTIGKERIFMALAEQLDCKVWTSTEKARVLKCIRSPEIDKRLTPDQEEAGIHVVEMGKLKNRRDLQQYTEQFPDRFDHVLAVSPTGWTHSAGSTADQSLRSMRIKTYGNVSSLDVPYSEHSSFSELRRFVRFLGLASGGCVVPTVNVGRPGDREAMKELFNVWTSEK